MSQATRPNDRHIIWSNQNLDVDDWREDYKEFLEANELDDDPNDEQALYEWMEETKLDEGRLVEMRSRTLLPCQNHR